MCNVFQMWKDDQNVHVFHYINWCSPKCERLFFSYLWLTKDPSMGNILREKRYGGTGLLSEKTKAMHVEFNERAEVVTSSYSAAVEYLQ